ncbi:MAG: NAD(P)H-dependent oxidoreductase subunit E [Oscillospiraceae bacterium]|jgi:NADH:ubiquinone oxidoreductase subunit E|nr:NAD(P)H-dependent oxidoreductase subunit E [Oscillospiraceae bacterium]
MLKKVSKLPFQGTECQAQAFADVIAQYKSDPSQLMTVMQKAQQIYGYLPFEVQAMIADGMDVPLEKVYGVSTFYAQFALSPAGKHSISVCLGTACYVKGAQAILDRITELLGIGPGECTEDGLFSLDACRCIGACGLAPVMMIGEKVYGNLVPEQVEGILAAYRDQ